MPKLVKNKEIIDDTWSYLEESADINAIETANPTIVTLEQWQSHRETLAKLDNLGVIVNGDCEIDSIENDLPHFKVVAIRFPAFADGRGYSLARLLRERYEFKGELRAVGDVLYDQLFYLQRCGFDAFELRKADDYEQAAKAFETFSVVYQAATDESAPIYRRR